MSLGLLRSPRSTEPRTGAVQVATLAQFGLRPLPSLPVLADLESQAWQKIFVVEIHWRLTPIMTSAMMRLLAHGKALFLAVAA